MVVVRLRDHFTATWANCKMIQTAHMDCAKDRCDLLEQSITPKLDEWVGAMQNSSVIVVHDKTNLEQRKSYLVPANINMNSITFTPENKLVCSIEGSEEQVEVDVDIWEDSSCWNLIATKVTSKWNDLFFNFQLSTDSVES
jgi:hypothetical protein